MPAYTTVVTHATGDVFPATDWNTYIRDDLAFVHDQGADLASAATITPTNQFHRVTGTTTITTIAAPSGTGQGGNRVLLKFQSAGCAITAGAALVLTGGAFVSVANGCIEFVWDATLAGWVEIGRLNFDGPGKEWDYKQITATVTVTGATTEGTAVTCIISNSVTYDGTRVKVEVFTPHFTGTTASEFLVLLRDSTVLGQVQGAGGGGGGQGDAPVKAELFDTPTAAAHTYTVKAFTSGTAGSFVAGAGGSGAQVPAFIRVTKA